MDNPENRAPLHNHHHHHHQSYPPPQFIKYSAYNYNNNNNNKYHHIHMSPKCPIHNRLIKPHTHHHPLCPHSLSPLSQPLMAQGDDETIFEGEEEEEDEPVFVLTDEWSDFFAKSDAKRKAVKKQAKKKDKETAES